MAKWTIEYGNDTGPDDGGFWEWWEVTDGERTFKCDKEAHAQWLLRVLEPVGQPPEWLRDEIAAKAMHALLVSDGTTHFPQRAKEAYDMADAMLAARVAPRE